MAFSLPTSADVAAPALPHRERYECPIGTCSWVYDAPPMPAVDPGVLAAILGPGVMAVQTVNRYHTTVEGVLEEHFSLHKLAEYVAEITNLRNLNIGLIGQMQQLSEAFKDALKASPDLQREVDPAVQLSVSLGQYPVAGL